MALVGCGDEGDLGSDATVDSAGAAEAEGSVYALEGGESAISCVVTPAQMEGPYFVDEGLNRSDIRSDPSDGSVKQGVQLDLTLRIYRAAGASCTPLVGALVDLWQADALGVYSDVLDGAGRFDTRGKKFLRGHQLTDSSGVVAFTTIYPGWYSGRTVHLHFKVRTDPTSSRGYEFTSQLYFPDTLTTQIHAANAPYNTRGRRDTTNARDGIYRSGGSQLTLHPTAVGRGYAATFDIGLRIT
jgi:protocatechuate 3,4-dioxygenase beta subunit